MSDGDGVMETVFDDPRFWDALDSMVNASWRGIKEVVDVLNEHTETIPLPLQGLLIGGMGTFVRTYAVARREANSPPLAFQHALQQVNAHPLAQVLIQQAANDAVDSKVATMKEGAE